MLSPLPPLLSLPTSCSIVKISPHPLGHPTDCRPGCGVCFMWRCARTYAATFFSLSLSGQTALQKEEYICIWFKQAFRTSWAFQGNDWSLVSFKTKGFPNSNISEGLGLFNHLLRVSEGVEMRYTMLLLDMSVSVNEWLPNDPLLNQHNTKITLFACVKEKRVLCGSWMITNWMLVIITSCMIDLITNQNFLLLV